LWYCHYNPGQSAATGDMTTDEIVHAATHYNKNEGLDHYLQYQSTPFYSTRSDSSNNTNAMIAQGLGRIEQLMQSLPSRMPKTDIAWNPIIQGITERVQEQGKIIHNHFNDFGL